MSIDGPRGIAECGFRVSEVLGRNVEGGRITYLGEAMTTGRRVVIKHFSFARQDADWAGYKAHERELELLQDLEHPGIPSYVDAFPLEDGFCLVQEFIDAPALSERRHYAYDEVMDIAQQLLAILVTLQDRHPPLLHRDLKPGNVLRGEDGRVYLVDFGLARPKSAPGTAATMSAGTPGFMAPEQFFGRGVDEATDLYGLGATLYALLGGISSEHIQNYVDTSFHLDFSVIRGAAPEWLIAWLERMTRPQNDERFRDAREALVALERAGSQPTQREPEPDQNASVVPEPDTASTNRTMIVVFGGLTAVAVVFSVGLLFLTSEPQQTKSGVMDWVEPLRPMPEQGGRLRCEIPMNLVGGKDGAPTALSRIDAAPGCKLVLRGIDVEDMIFTNPGAELTITDARVKRLDVDGAKVTLKSVELEQLRSRSESRSRPTIEADGVEVTERLDIYGADVTGDGLRSSASYNRIDKGAKVKLGDIIIDDSLTIASEETTARFDSIRVSDALSVDRGAMVRASDAVIVRLVVNGGEVALDSAEVTNGGSVAEDAVLVMRAPVLQGKLHERGTVIFVEESEDLDGVFERERRAHREAVAARRARERKVREFEEKAAAIEEASCALVGSCAREEQALDGPLKYTISVAEGEAALEKSSLESACLRQAVSALDVPSGVSGTVTCSMRIERRGSAAVINDKRSRSALDEAASLD
jgi:hypothetical protein